MTGERLRPMGQGWARLTAALGKGIDHPQIAAGVAHGGRLSGSYLMMSAISAAIAVLGLLLSSPAVVIGAMLLSPLMGPIVALGFGFWTVDWAATRGAVASLAAGLGLALFVSILLVTLSPLKEPTAEILARCRPTLFDLLVAIFSGVAGGYAVVRGRGEAVMGVAIATALMPPLATAGFGISTRSWSIAGGAMLLFLTNLVAIALAAAAVAAFTGFRPKRGENGRTWLHHAAVAGVLLALCVPLTLSLQTIALESRATTLARADVVEVFGAKARVASLSVRSEGRSIAVEGLIATPVYVRKANQRMQSSLTAALRAPVSVKLDQVVLADPSRIRPAPAPAVAPPPDPAADLRAAIPYADITVLHEEDGPLVARIGPASGLDLAGARELETALRRQSEFAGVTVIPPLQTLPSAPVKLGDRRRGPSLGDLSLDAWALKRWKASGAAIRLCRAGRRPSLKALRPLLNSTFAPLPVTLEDGDRSDCAGAATKAPFLLIGPASPPVAHAGAGGTGRRKS